MPFRFDTEEEQEARKSQRSGAAIGRTVGTDTEIALGTRSLLAIFFGLVLICAVFFGLGYSVGRGSGERAAAQPASESASATPDSRLPKPSADQGLTPVEAPASTPSDSGTSTDNTPATQPSSSAPQPAAGAGATAPTNPYAPSAATSGRNSAGVPTPALATTASTAATLQPAAATTATNFMVQVAAVRVPQDAQILVDALKKHGYSASVRNEPQDQLLHIQLGPYTSRADALAMRSKLLGDGYNAVLK